MKRNSSKPKRRYGDAGFTLVELVVVIAVLAILAGVGAVAYNGYIEYAKKGVDKKTVGEVMHAIELANYDDPSLFENQATVFISGPEGNGITSLPDINNALSTALGDLTTVKLSEKSVGDPAGILTALSSNNRYNDYITAAKDGAKATFADDVFGLWDSVVEAKENFGGTRTDYLDLAIKYAKNYGTEGKSPAIDNWKNSAAIDDLGAEQGQAVALARNYCFAVYAAQKELTPAMQKQLQDFIDGGYGLYGAAGLHTKFFGDIFDKDEDGNSTKSAWDQIVNDYEREQADIDVKAYLALMAAAETIDSTGTMQDDELMGEMNKVLGSLDAVMRDSENAEKIKTIGKCATITVIKNPDGTLKMTVTPPELDPRTESGNDTPQEEVDYTQDGATLNFGSGATTGDIVMKPGSTITITISNLPGDESGVSGYNVSTGGNVSSNSNNQAAKTVTITAGEAGSGTVTVSWTVGGIIPASFTLNVSIK